MIDPNNQFTQLQQQTYDYLADMDRGRNVNGNVLQIYDDYFFNELWKYIPSIHDKDVLDFGCGPGRNLIFYHDKVKSIDGVDIAVKNLQTAREWIMNNGWNPTEFNLYKNDGISLTGIPTENYDIVMSTICLQHISVYDIRFNLLKEFHRVLRLGGYVTLQFLYSTDKPNVVSYHSNNQNVIGTNGAADCMVTNVNFVLNDLEKIGFGNFNYHITQAFTSDGLPPTIHDDKEWLFVTGQKI